MKRKPGEDFAYDAETLLVCLRIFLNEPPSEATRKALDTALANVSEWYERDDPAVKGIWVDDKGRP